MKVVKARMDNEIKHVETELSTDNLEYITTNNLPTDANQKTVDLAALWEEYIEKHLARFERRGVDWLTEQLNHAIPLYETELKKLKMAQNKLTKEAAMKNRNDKIRISNVRETTANKLKTTLKQQKIDLEKAKAAHKAEVKKYEAIQKKVKAVAKDKRDDERKKIGFWTQVRAKSKASVQEYDEQMNFGRTERAIIKLDHTNLPLLLKEVGADVIQLKTYRNAVKMLEKKLADEELLLATKYLVI